MRNKRGITLIALIITIIVLLILAGVSLSALVGENGILNRATDAKIKTKFAKYNEALGLNAVDDTGVYAVKDKMKAYIPDMEDSDLDKFVIVKSKLLYVGTDAKEMEVAEKLGIGSGGEGSDSKATVEEIQEIVDGVVELKDKFADGQDSTNDNTETGFIGTKLLDRKTHLYDGTWNILIDYNKDNKETGRYEKGYWLEKGKTYTINDKSIEFKNDYVIDYENKDFTVLSENKVNWNEKATLGVTDNLPLNLDPMKLTEGYWVDSKEANPEEEGNFYNFMLPNEDKPEEPINTGIQKFSDVEYDKSKKALRFNESLDNEYGEGGYIRLNKNGVRLNNGFTFEYYGKFTRDNYDNQLHSLYEGDMSMGVFCKTKSLLTSNDIGIRCMRVLFGKSGFIADFCNHSVWTGMGYRMKNGGSGDLSLLSSNGGNKFEDYFGFKSGEDVSFSIVYLPYVEDESKQYLFDDFMKKDKTVDKVEYFVNGKLYGYTYQSKASMEKGTDLWDNDDCKFFVGVCMGKQYNNLYYLKGDCYSLRLYDMALSENEVKLNYDMTLKDSVK